MFRAFGARARNPFSICCQIQSFKSYSSKKGLFSEIINSVKVEVSKDEELRQSLLKMEARLTDVKENPALKAIKEAASSIVTKNSNLAQRISSIQRKGDELIRKHTENIGRKKRLPLKPESFTSKLVHSARVNMADSTIVKNLGKSVDTLQSTIVDESDSLLYGGFATREFRHNHPMHGRKSRKSHVYLIKEDPNAGTSISVTEGNFASTIKGKVSAALSTMWDTLCEQNPLIRKAFEVRRSYEESNNVFAYLARSVTSSLTSPFKSLLFKESETAQVIKEIRATDPSFSVEGFLSEAAKFIIPDILEAIIVLDRPALKGWCSEALFVSLSTSFPQNVIGEGQILDLRHVDLITARIVNEYPVLVISFSTQQVSCIKDSITGAIIRGSPDSIDSINYIWALAKTPDIDPLTGGWRLIEMSARDARSSL